jgi:hypothetical protein
VLNDTCVRGGHCRQLGNGPFELAATLSASSSDTFGQTVALNPSGTLLAVKDGLQVVMYTAVRGATGWGKNTTLSLAAVPSALTDADASLAVSDEFVFVAVPSQGAVVAQCALCDA